MDTYLINSSLSLQNLSGIIEKGQKIALSEQAVKRIKDCKSYLDSKTADPANIMYGINTGFGSLCNTVIAPDQLSDLQRNLLLSHACGMGDEVPAEIVKLMLLLKVQSLAYGHSGVQLQTVERLIYFYNNDILPVVYEQGSLGASGDLAPLAHLCLPLLGEGEVKYKGERLSAAALCKKLDLAPITLQAKEGLALINGTQFMSAYGTWCLMKVQKLSNWADAVASISIEAFDARKDAFEPHTHRIRPHKGQLHTAENISRFLKDSTLFSNDKAQVQDPYSFRCIPQVHGASKDAISYVQGVFETEISSVSDNPNIFPDEDRIISGGNFHGQPLALALDFLAMACAELANISERRVYKLISGERGLPAFLTANPGLNSGLMIAQYTAASIVSQNKQLCTPASVDSIVSSNGQEDHVSMGANAAVKAYKVTENLQSVLGIELLTASRALQFRDMPGISSFSKNTLKGLSASIPFFTDDVYLHDMMMAARKYIGDTSL